VKKILIAGIGNIFHGDDAFGCEVIRQLEAVAFSKEVTVRDFGIRSYDLAYALTEDYDAIILVDAASRGQPPGTLYLIEPDPHAWSDLPGPAPDAHSMNSVSVIQMAQSLGGVKGKLFLVGCEPAALPGDEGEIGLSESVQRTIPEAITMLASLVGDLLAPKAKENVQLTSV
jgi:hydrogenase maturation protease